MVHLYEMVELTAAQNTAPDGPPYPLSIQFLTQPISLTDINHQTNAPNLKKMLGHKRVPRNYQMDHILGQTGLLHPLFF